MSEALQAELELTASVHALLAPWLAAEQAREQGQYSQHSEEFAQFLAWCALYGLTPPVGDTVVAGYLLELAADGASVDEISRAADGVEFFYRMNGRALDPTLIRAALALAAEQMRPDRTLN